MKDPVKVKEKASEAAAMPQHWLCLFDIDGTLVYVKEEVAFVEAFRELYGVAPSIDWARSRPITDWGVAVGILREVLKREPSRKEVTVVLDRFVSLLEQFILDGRTPLTPVAGVREFLRELAKEGVTMALATGSYRPSAELKMRVAKLDGFFATGAYSDGMEERDEILQLAIERAGQVMGRVVRSDEVLFFGDKPWDVESARRVGVQFAGIAINQSAAETLRKAEAPQIFRDYDQVLRAWEKGEV